MNRKVLLAFGLLMIAVAVAVNYKWREMVLAQNDPGRTVKVLASREAIEAGTQITSNLLDSKFQLVSMPEKWKYEHSIDEERLPRVLGQTLRRKLEAGERVTFFDFDTGAGQGGRLSDALPVEGGHVRAVTVSVDEHNSFAGQLRAGDRVDILATLRHPTTGQVVTTSFKNDVEILHVGGSHGAATSVTIALYRKDAAMAALLDRTAEMTFLLRNRDDNDDPGDLGEVNVSMLLNVPPDRPRPPRIGPIIIRPGSF